MTLSADKGTYFIDQNTSLMPQHPFEPMFRAAASMSQDMSFDDIDIVTNRNSLRKLLDFCSPRSQESFRLHLHLVRNTLIVERCEKHAREFVDGSRGWGRNFEKASTAFPPNLTESQGHHRTLRYSLGALKCAVQFEVDASFDPNGEPVASKDLGPLDLAMEKLSIQTPEPATKNGARDLQVETTYREAMVMPQSTTAEIKSAAKVRPLSWRMPQLWFGRTPWLIIGHHADGKFHDVKITEAAAHFTDWEKKQQTALRKLATVLGELRAAVRGNEGRYSAAVFERGSGSIRVFDLTSNRQAVPEDLRKKLWT
ncbi:geranylgeranyl pyrophosphate synthetase [Colletotrichum higginsianum]|nr:geranylgeranyl pyrophosphate synthetase [Colletotrichum higginsianum]